MTRVRLMVTEAWSSIAANLSTTLAAVITVLIGMVLLGLVLALGTWLHSWSAHIKSDLKVKVYFQQDATRADETKVLRRIAGDPRVKTIDYVSKAEALATMKKKLPELFRGGLPSNPLPDALVVTPKKGEFTEKLGRDLTQSKLPFVDTIRWGGKTAHRVLTVARVIEVVFAIAVILLVAASTLLIANTIRLSIFARRREIEVMKLVGATNWFVRGPFMLEGLVCGLFGSLAAVILLVLGKELALPSILPHLGGGSDVHAWPFGLISLILLSAGLVLGAAGSGVTLRRFLQV